ncbi:MAG TPA: helix-turn-helix domain-containing protein [Solirubrobacteraceae bacterium]|jgi:AcrR family transcriptional regulator
MTEMLSSEERPLRADARRNRQRILESAGAVFSESGSEAQIDDVARRAGVGVGTVYRHFPTKEALVAELVRQKFELFAARANEALELPGEPFTVLADMLRANAADLERDVVMQEMVAGLDDHIWTVVQPAQDEMLRAIQVLIDRAHRAGTMRPDATASDIGMLMCGLCATMAQTARDFDWRRHLDLMIEMLRGRPGPAQA